MTIATANQGIQSRFVANVGVRQSTSLAGDTITVDDFAGGQSGVFQLVYRGVSETVKDAFFTEYNSNSLSEFSLTWQMDSSVHTVVYAGQPQATYRQEADAWDVEVQLAKVTP